MSYQKVLFILDIIRYFSHLQRGVLPYAWRWWLPLLGVTRASLASPFGFFCAWNTVELCVARLIDVFFSESNHICLRSTRPKGHGRRVPQRKAVPSHVCTRICAWWTLVDIKHWYPYVWMFRYIIYHSYIPLTINMCMYVCIIMYIRIYKYIYLYMYTIYIIYIYIILYITIYVYVIHIILRFHWSRFDTSLRPHPEVRHPEPTLDVVGCQDFSTKNGWWIPN